MATAVVTEKVVKTVEKVTLTLSDDEAKALRELISTTAFDDENINAVRRALNTAGYTYEYL